MTSLPRCDRWFPWAERSSSWRQAVVPGETLVREQIHGAYGGNSQAGISRSSNSPNVLVYSDHEKAADNGYDFDGWDRSLRVYYYTGEGKVGDQTLARGNRAIAEHQRDAAALRLFVAVGYRPGTGTRIHHDIGQFAVDSELPYVVRRAPGIDGVPRDVLVSDCCPSVHSPLKRALTSAPSKALVNQRPYPLSLSRRCQSK